MEEQSILDYLKAKLTPWRGKPAATIEEPTEKVEESMRGMAESKEQSFPGIEPAPEVVEKPARPNIRWPLGVVASVMLALIAQSALEPPGQASGYAISFYLLAAAGLLYACWRGQMVLQPLPDMGPREGPLPVRMAVLLVAFPASLLAFLAFGGGLFNSLNVFLWVLSIVSFSYLFWLGKLDLVKRVSSIAAFLRKPHWKLTITWDHVVVVGVVLLIVIFRAYRLNEVPPEMVSDHAEKLLDVSDVLNGQTSIFFPRNTGREAFQMYLTAGIALLFGTGLSFLTLKIGTVLAGMLTLPFIYLLGKEFGSKRLGLAAMAFAGIAYWPNVISRVALRFTLYPFFVAPTLYYLVRGLRTSNRNDFILAGIFLGLGLHGYSTFRIVPFVVVVAVGLYLLHNRNREARRHAITGLVVVVIISLVVFLPLLRYALENPDMFSYRAMTRLGSLEKPLDAPAWQIFFKNLWNASTMFAWDNGEVWVVSIPHRPALSVVSAALFHLGIVLVIYRYLKRRHWLDLFLLLSVPLLLLPSILSLAFPAENPILNRTAGAIVPAFVLVGIALEGILSAFKTAFGSPWGSRLAWGVGLSLFLLSARQDYDLVFRQYQEQYVLSSWNTSEMGEVIRNFADTIGSPDSAWVAAFPYWVDTRLVGINAGFPLRDYAIWPEQFRETLSNPDAKLFIVKPEDVEGLAGLRELYPSGSVKEYTNPVEGKSFFMFFVPPAEGSQ